MILPETIVRTFVEAITYLFYLFYFLKGTSDITACSQQRLSQQRLASQAEPSQAKPSRAKPSQAEPSQAKPSLLTTAYHGLPRLTTAYHCLPRLTTAYLFFICQENFMKNLLGKFHAELSQQRLASQAEPSQAKPSLLITAYHVLPRLTTAYHCLPRLTTAYFLG